MRATKKKSARKKSIRMVEAKRRLRLARMESTSESSSECLKPRKPAAKWTIEIRDGEHGDRLRFSLYRTPWQNSWFDGRETVSTATIIRRIKTLISEAA